MTGESVWTLKLEPGFSGGGRGPASGGGRVYAYGDTTMYAVDGATGELVESFGDGGRLQILNEALQFKYPDTFPPDLDPASIGFRLVTPPVYFENTLYTGAAVSEGHIPGGLVIANDATTGAIKWVFNTVPQGPSDDGGAAAPESAAGSGRRQRSTLSSGSSTSTRGTRHLTTMGRRATG
jgi:outer membrane protein assembly factor BamB